MEDIERDMMTRAERAKIFMPFDAMKGLQEALRDREERHTRVQRREISEEAAEQNSSIILKLEKGMKIKVFCYSAFHDIVKTGTVTDIDLIYKSLKIDGERIWFDDIYSIGIVEFVSK